MGEIRLYKNPWKALKLLAICTPFVALGIWILTKEDSSIGELIMGSLTTLFFGLGIVIGLFHLFDRRPQIIINEIGIWDRTTNLELIKWEFIKNAYSFQLSGQKFVSLKLDKKFELKVKQYKWATKLSKAVGAQKVNLSLGQLKIDSIELKKLIIEMTKAEKTERINKVQIIQQQWS